MWCGLAVVALLSGLCAHLNAGQSKAKRKPYPLDKLSRRIPKRGPVPCPKLDFVIYRGKHLKYQFPAKVYAGFRDRLAKFEKVVSEVGTEFYGRPPRRIVHMGTYSCRRISAYPTWLSEHAFGNAIDIEGFDFGPLPRGKALPQGVHRAFRGYFRVRVLNHWKVKRGPAKVHARFLRALVKKLQQRRDIFRCMLGPAYPGHRNHFHFDAAPWRIIDGFVDP